MNDPIELIQEERRRQIAKGFDAKHDDSHTDQELPAAAGSYIAATCFLEAGTPVSELTAEAFQRKGETILCWPWEDAYWRPEESPILNLVKAGALIVAEIERLQRAELKGGR